MGSPAATRAPLPEITVSGADVKTQRTKDDCKREFHVDMGYRGSLVTIKTNKSYCSSVPSLVILSLPSGAFVREVLSLLCLVMGLCGLSKIKV